MSLGLPIKNTFHFSIAGLPAGTHPAPADVTSARRMHEMRTDTHTDYVFDPEPALEGSTGRWMITGHIRGQRAATVCLYFSAKQWAEQVLAHHLGRTMAAETPLAPEVPYKPGEVAVPAAVSTTRISVKGDMQWYGTFSEASNAMRISMLLHIMAMHNEINDLVKAHAEKSQAQDGTTGVVDFALEQSMHRDMRVLEEIADMLNKIDFTIYDKNRHGNHPT